MNYKILNPGGNKTALVFGKNYTNEEKKAINDKILEENSEVEQVGFLDKENKKLDMAGGEFCVNATRCAIWEVLAGKDGEVEIKVSGCKEKIVGGITKNKKVYANMELNAKLDSIVDKKKDYTIIKLDGIVLLVMSAENSKQYIEKLEKDEESAKLELKEIMKKSKIKEKAIGVILLEENEQYTKIYPVIWVTTIDTLYYETACGSGSLATSIYKFCEDKIKEISIVQPSGFCIEVSLEIKGEMLKKARIEGIVEE